MIKSVQVKDLTQDKQTGDFCVHLSKLRKEKNKHIFQLTCAHEGEGSTTFAVNVAKLLAKREKASKILLVDANFIHPQLFACFTLKANPGLKQLLSGETTEADVLHQIGTDNLYVLTTGIESGDKDFQLSIGQLGQIFDSLQEQFDYILVDSASIMGSHNAIAIALASDETFLVIQAGRNNVKALQNALSKLTDHNCSIHSAVLNRISRPIPAWLYQWLD